MIIEQSAAQSTRPRTEFFDIDLPERTGGACPPCRILVVDDDALVRARLSTLLSAAHYQVELAATGIEALRVLDETPCDIVLTDWFMPDMDGLAFSVGRRARGVAGHFDAPADVREFLSHLLDDERDASLP